MQYTEHKACTNGCDNEFVPEIDIDLLKQRARACTLVPTKLMYMYIVVRFKLLRVP